MLYGWGNRSIPCKSGRERVRCEAPSAIDPQKQFGYDQRDTGCHYNTCERVQPQQYIRRPYPADPPGYRVESPPFPSFTQNGINRPGEDAPNLTVMPDLHGRAICTLDLALYVRRFACLTSP